MESLLLTTTASNLLTGRNSSVSSLSSSSSLGSIPSGKVEVRRSRIGKVKTPTSIVASVSKRGTGKGSSANVAVDGSVAAVAAVEDVPTASWKDVQYPAGSIGHRQPKPTEVDKEKQMEYITKILGSTVYDVAVETPLQLAPLLSQQLGVNLWLKREDSQQVFSFKIRGAYNMISQLPEDQRERGVICASAGNHAQGVALSGKRLKIISNIVMPKTTPQIKIDAVKRLGGLVETYGDSFDEAQARAKQRAVDENLTFIPPFDDEDVIAGQGTVGMEIGRQIRGDIHAIFVPVGGGGLIAGIASFFKLVYPGVKVFGVEPNDQNSMAQALKLGHIVNVTDIGHFADGVAVQQVGNETFRISNELVDDIILVDKYAISKAVQDMFNDGRNILEPSGALSIAAAKAYCEYNNIKGVNVVAVTSGANMNFSQLRVISDIANNDTQTILVSILPEQPGSLDKLSTLIHDLGFNLLETSYRFGEGSTDAVVVYKVDAVGSDLQNLLLELNSVGFETYALNDNDAAASHLRHMTGGRAKVENEALFRFTFPERKGALKHFLHGFQPNWNISLFHHRAEGILKSSVLVGIQLEKSEEKNFHAYAKKVGYKYEVLSPDDAAYILTSKP